jgi:hypothetical protein
MASVQQLEKLHNIQRLFYVEDSLEGVVAGQRVSQIIGRTEQLIRQRAFLRDERRRLRMSTEMLDERKSCLKIMQRDDWVPPTVLADSKQQKEIVGEDTTTPSVPLDPHVLINIGGLMFEVPVSTLIKDPKSLLAQLTNSETCPILPDHQGGFYYFDRDWWLFRYIVNFLRDGVLPDDRSILSQLYREASFWNLEQMQRAIEEQKLHLRHETPKKEAVPLWWQKLPSWWQAVDLSENEKKEKIAAAAKENEDWWTDTAYHGKTFLPLSVAPDKVVTLAGAEDEMKSTSSTYGREK